MEPKGLRNSNSEAEEHLYGSGIQFSEGLGEFRGIF
jgi:hypothetical protein